MNEKRKILWDKPNEDYEYLDKNSRKPPKKYSQRLLGLVFTLAGCLCGYFMIYQKLQQMKHGVENIDYSIQGILLCPLLLFIGLAALVVPTSAFDGIKAGGNSKWMWIIIALMLGAFALTYFLFKQHAELYGYFM